MATRRTRSERVHLRVQTADDPDDTPSEGTDIFWTRLPWPAVSLGAGLLAVALTWGIAAVATVALWLVDRRASFGSALTTATDVWRAAHGAGFAMGEQLWTVIPLGLTLVPISVLALVARRAARVHAAPDEPGADEPGAGEAGAGARLRIAARGTGLMVLGYTAGTLLVTLATGPTQRWAVVLGVSVLVSALGAWWGTAHPVGASFRAVLPRWARPVPGAVGWAWLTTCVGGAAAVVTTVIQQWPRVMTLQDQLGFSGVETVAAWLVQLSFWVNLVLWGVAWTLGAGIRLGAQSLLTPAGTDIGFLPAVPVFGAVPPEGPHSPLLLLWLAVGVAGGFVAAARVLRERPEARCDETAIGGGIAGVLAGVLVALTCALSGGDLGVGNLTGLGPRPAHLFVLAPAILGLAGMAFGLVWGLIRMLGQRDAAAPDESDADEPAADEPDADEPAADEPDADEPAADEPDADEPEADAEADEPTNPRIGLPRPPGAGQ